MRGEEVGRAHVRAVAAGAQIGVAAHRGEEARGAERVVAGVRRDADAELVGLEFLGAREARELDLGAGERQRALLRVAQHVVDHRAADRDLARLFLAQRRMLEDHVRHLVREHRGELGVVVGDREQPARDVELAGRQREGIDRRRVEQRHLVGDVGSVGGGDQAVDDPGHLHFELGVIICAAIGREDTLVLALGRRGRGRVLGRRLLRRRRHQILLVAGEAVARAGGERKRGGDQGEQRPSRTATQVGPARLAHRQCRNRASPISVPPQ